MVLEKTSESDLFGKLKQHQLQHKEAHPLPWASIGRRIGSLGHVISRLHGGTNRLENLAWPCLWCNTWQSERRPGATDHGGLFPDDMAK
jgi:hypothetical protein